MEINNCSKCDCGQKRVIVNKKYYLCQQKNSERLKTNKISKIKSVKRISDKQKQALIDLKNVYKEISLEREHICTGCGTNKCLSHSHLIPRSKRKDLETDKKNITYHCLIKCHNIWEHGSIEEKTKLLDFEKNMEYIKNVDNSYYNLLILKWKK